LATLLAEHLDDMSAASLEMPVETREKKFAVSCEVAKEKVVVCPDIDGGYLVFRVKFKQVEHAQEFADAVNENKVIRTPIAFHLEGCCGCVDVYFSRDKQEIIAICNECGLRRQLRLNTGDNDIIGQTSPFTETAKQSNYKKHNLKETSIGCYCSVCREKLSAKLEVNDKITIAICKEGENASHKRDLVLSKSDARQFAMELLGLCIEEGK
jgi:hypothetical protein